MSRAELWRNDLYMKTRLHMAITHALCGKLIALHKNDNSSVMAAEQYIAGFRNLLVEIDATGTQRKFAPGLTIELKAPSTSDGVIAGWASTRERDAYGHEVVGGAFAESIRNRGLTGPKAIKLLLDHDWTKPAGLIRVLEYRGDRLWIEARMNLDIEYVRDRYSAAKMLNGFNFSVGFMLEDFSIKTDARKQEYLEITKGDLFEVSVVAFPANEAATLHEIKGFDTSAINGAQAILDQIAEMKRVLR